MILIDTSVWVDHLRHGNGRLRTTLEEGRAVCHPFVIGELACGHLQERAEVLGLLSALPQTVVAEHGEVLHLLEERELSGRGLGWVDVHLLASVLLSHCRLWTLDGALSRAASSLGVSL